MSFIVFRNRIDIYNKTTTTNLAGQKKPTFSLFTSGQKCHFIPITSEPQMKIAYSVNELGWLFLPSDVDIDYIDRLFNLRDKKGNIIEAGPLQLDGIRHEPGFSGKTRHFMARIKRVTDT